MAKLSTFSKADVIRDLISGQNLLESTGDGSITDFTLSENLQSPSSVIVFIDGNAQDTSTYSITNNTLSFSSAPSNGSPVFAWEVTGSSNDQVMASSSDTTNDYLSNKLVAGTNITLSVNNSGSNESITIDASSSGGTVEDLIGSSNGTTILDGIEVSSAVNYGTLTNSVSGNNPELSVDGSDTNISLVLSPKGTGNLVLDGLNWPTSDGASGQIIETDGSSNLSWRYEPYDLSFFRPGTLSDGETVLVNVTAHSFFYPSGFSGSQGYAVTAPADGSKSFDVQKNGASIGSVDFAQGSNTPTFTLSSDTSFAAGDRITIVAPSTADSSMADVTITLSGNRT